MAGRSGPRVEFDTDVYISYAHLDNRPLTEGQTGWVSVLHQALNVRLEQILGQAVKVYRDETLTESDASTVTMSSRLFQAATFVCVVSPRYVESFWSVREVNEFVRSAEATGGAVVDGRQRIFKVVKSPVPVDRQPPAIASLLGYEFCDVDAGMGDVKELDPTAGADAQRAFLEKVNELADDIAGILRIMYRDA